MVLTTRPFTMGIHRANGVRRFGTAGDDLFYGGSLDDVLVGYGGNDALYGSNGNDKLDGGEGNDHLFGGEGDDSLVGGNGNDTILGGNGSDKIVGGLGSDTLTGGSGQDNFVFHQLDGTNVDIITDFKLDSMSTWNGRPAIILGDRIEIRASGFGATSISQFSYNSSTGQLFFDASSSDTIAPVNFLTLQNKPSGFTTSYITLV